MSDTMIDTSHTRAVIFDLDGTLLSKQKFILPGSLKAIEKLRKKGFLIGIATGRSLRSIKPVLDLVPVDLPLTLLNGSLIIDHHSHGVMDRLLLPVATVKKVYDITRYTSLRLHVYTDDQVFLDMSDAPLYRRIDPISYADCASIEGINFSDYNFHKAMITGKETETLGWELLNTLLQESPGEFYPVSSFKDHIEIMHPEANKRNGLKFIATNHGLDPSSIIAFGDADNDLDVIRNVGWGVAMGNASENLKRYADIVIGPNDEESIAAYLTELFNL